MIIYVIVFLILAFFSLAYQNGRLKKASMLPFLIILLLVALRDKSVGIDTISYVEEYIYGRNATLKTEAEFGFTFWIEFLKLFSRQGEWFLFATSCLCMLPLLSCIKKFSFNPYLSILLFMIYDGGMGLYMNATRQAIAVSFCIFTFFIIDFKEKRTIILSAIIIIAASLFHTSALTCFGFIFLSKLPLTSRTIKIFVLVISVILGLFVRLNFFSFLPSLLQIGMFAANAGFYEEYSSFEADLNFNGLITEIMPISVILFFVVKYSEDTPIQRICFWSVVLSNLFANTPFLPRFFVYGVLPFIILMPNCYNRIPKIGKYAFNSFLVIMFLFFILYSTVNNGIEDYKFYILQ